MIRRVDEESRLSRWSRRKAEARATEEKSALKQRSGSADQSALKQRSGSADQSALKQGSGSADQSALKQGSGSADQSALKQRSGSAAPVADGEAPAKTPGPAASGVWSVPGAEGPAMPWTPPLAYADENDDRPVGLYEPDETATEEISDDDRAKAAEMGLPDIETLGPGSDFKPFLAQGVPHVLKRLALRKLWLSNPAFAVLDGLNDYDENFRVTNVLIDAAQTAYRSGKGYLEKADDTEDAPGEDASGEDAPGETADGGGTEQAAAPEGEGDTPGAGESSAGDGDDPAGDEPDEDAVGDAEDDLV